MQHTAQVLYHEDDAATFVVTNHIMLLEVQYNTSLLRTQECHVTLLQIMPSNSRFQYTQMGRQVFNLQKY